MTYTPLEKKLLNDFQRDFPLSATPFADIAAEVGASEEEVLEAYRSLDERKVITRIGGIFRPGSVGASTLVAAEVPKDQLEEIAAVISAHPNVNHNYEREHRLNLWFVVTADTQGLVDDTLDAIEQETGLALLDLPMLEAFHLDLGFQIKWNGTQQTAG